MSFLDTSLRYDEEDRTFIQRRLFLWKKKCYKPGFTPGSLSFVKPASQGSLIKIGAFRTASRSESIITGRKQFVSTSLSIRTLTQQIKTEELLWCSRRQSGSRDLRFLLFMRSTWMPIRRRQKFRLRIPDHHSPLSACLTFA